ncbi:MAG: phosphoenolpyruvate carboxykinase (GTP) [Anaerolineae bacterium]|nr:phosphoenolpyruvate carboxykinase (GTP) [Anaerolineae bacterium]
MAENPSAYLKSVLPPDQMAKLKRINNQAVLEFVARFVRHCRPSNVFVTTDSAEDIEYVRRAAIRDGEEGPLAIPGHTYHFDSPADQARDRKNTRLLLPKGVELGPQFETLDRDEGLADVLARLDGLMQGHTMYVRFFSLGPVGSDFSNLAVQLTDSAYVAHNEDLLYRTAYDEFVRLGEEAEFFRFVHSAGELNNHVSNNIDQRRVFIDLQEDTVYSANTQYGGNTIGLKKLAMRLAINKASAEGHLCEHMFIMGVHGPKGRVSYFTGAFPSLCGKTSTSMLEGETIVGDDIAYLRNVDGVLRAVNVERGIFGIIQGVNAKDDPIIWKALHSPGEIIFSNILVTEDGGAYWIDKGTPMPSGGTNHTGPWFPGKLDSSGKEVPPSHPNARFTLSLPLLENTDAALDDPAGVGVAGIIYGGRDYDTWVPVEEAFDWVHGIVTKGASLESQTTAATLGAEGVREFNPMSNLDFLPIPIGRYVSDNLKIAEGLAQPPRIFSVNYFLQDTSGRWLNSRADKRVWLKWMDLRVNDEVGAIQTPTGYIPLYEDLARLFQEVLGREYRREDYVQQFSLRVPENLAKVDRISAHYRERVLETPEVLLGILGEQRQRLEEARVRWGDYVEPDAMPRA